MVAKEYKTWLIVDSKTGKFKVISNKVKLNVLKTRLKGTEIPIDFTMKVDVPATPILKAQGEIKLSQMQISELLLTEIEEEDNPQP